MAGATKYAFGGFVTILFTLEKSRTPGRNHRTSVHLADCQLASRNQ